MQIQVNLNLNQRHFMEGPRIDDQVSNTQKD